MVLTTTLVSAASADHHPVEVTLRAITGRVVDAETNEALIGVNVLVKGTTSGGITDIDGNYSVTAEAGDILTFSYLGYESIEYRVNNQAVINVELEPDAAQLDEVSGRFRLPASTRPFRAAPRAFRLRRIPEPPAARFPSACGELAPR